MDTNCTRLTQEATNDQKQIHTHVLAPSRTTAASFPASNLSPGTRRVEARTCPPVLLHAVAAVVELSEGGGELVQVVAERVEQQVVQDLLQDLREAQDAPAQLPLLLVIQDDLGGLRRLPQRRLVDVGQAGDGPAGGHT